MLIYANYRFKIFRVKRNAYPIVRQLKIKLTVKKSASESSKMREKQMLGPKEPPGHLSVKNPTSKNNNK